ncbi:MAG: hypothetical protein AAGN46_14015 [Acidobacteriota bacterium]
MRSMVPFCIALALAALFAFAPAAEAQVAVGGTVGTLGAGVEVVFGDGPLRGRLLVAGFDIDVDLSSDSVDYDGEAQLRHAGALLDWHPGSGGFRLSGGVFFNDTVVDATTSLEQLLESELDTDIPPIPGFPNLGTVSGEGEGEEIAPYLGVGFGGGRATSGWSFRADLGVMYFGQAEIELAVDTDLPIGLVPGGPELLDELIEQEERDLEEDLEDYELYPVVALGLSYRF